MHTNKPVVSGLMNTLPKKSTLVDFKRHLQCSTNEPNLNFNNGMISRLRLVPPASRDFMSMCGFVESKGRDPWYQNNENINKYRNGEYVKGQATFNALAPWSVAELLRVINGTLYYDWPWGIERLNHSCPTNPVAPLINATLSRISDMRDSVFFTGGADPALKGMDIQIPYISHCTHENYADMIAPWVNMWSKSLADYRKAREQSSNFSEAAYLEQEVGYKSWQDKIPKAALFSSCQQQRIFMFDVARQRPDLIDSINYYELGRKCLEPWHPLSTESCYGLDKSTRQWPTPQEVESYQSLPPGFTLPLYNVTSPTYTTYFPGAYKYVVIPLGKQKVLSTSARIIHVMFYSGAVAMLPRTSWIFHFQAQLKPWVHYVPISFTGADLAEKVQWLKDHDDLAQQIAENGRNFARSYMRLEDFYCYTANWLDVMAEISLMSDLASTTFSPQLYPKVCANARAQYEFPA